MYTTITNPNAKMPILFCVLQPPKAFHPSCRPFDANRRRILNCCEGVTEEACRLEIVDQFPFARQNQKRVGNVETSLFEVRVDRGCEKGIGKT